MEQEWRKLEGKAEKSHSSPKQLYYKVMNKGSTRHEVYLPNLQCSSLRH